MVNEQQEARAQAFEYMQKLNFIIKKIRLSESAMFETKTPEQSDNRKIVEKVDFPNEGGVYTYFEGMEHPVKGFPEGETVERLDEAKKMIMRILKGFSGMNKSKFILLVLFKSQIEKMVESLIISFWEYIKKYRSKTERYCVVSREMYRVFNLMEQGILLEKIRDNVCMILEYDDAYRYRFQHIISKINKEAFSKNPIKELKRLFKILEQHEKEQSMKDKWRMVSKLLFLLRFRKEFNTFKNFIILLDIDKLKLDEADLFHAKVKPSYIWQDNIAQ